MNKNNLTRRDTLRTLGAGALAALGTRLTSSAAEARVDDSDARVPQPSRRRARVLMDGHVHVTNKTFWLGIDTWQPSPTGTGWDSSDQAAGRTITPYGSGRRLGQLAPETVEP